MSRKTQRQRPLVHFFTTRGGGYKMEATTSLCTTNLSQHVIITTSQKSMCPKSYLYIYDFRAIYINVHTNRSNRSGPVLEWACSLFLPSGGICFPTITSAVWLKYCQATRTYYPLRTQSNKKFFSRLGNRAPRALHTIWHLTDFNSDNTRPGT